MRSLKLLLPGAIIAAAAVAPPTAQALDVLMKTTGPVIQGDSQIPNHKGEIDILSWGWGVSNSFQPSPGGGGGGSGNAAFQSLTINKLQDQSTDDLINTVFTSNAIQEVFITSYETIQGNFVPTTDIKLTGAFVESVSASTADGNDVVSETISLRFECIEITNTSFDPATGQPTGTTNFEWNIAKNQQSC